MSARVSAVVAVVALGLTPGARASEDPVLERLTRIATGRHVSPVRHPPVSRPARRPPYAAEIRAAARRHGVPVPLLFALVRAESGFDPRAVSSKGARGLGQLMPATARGLGVRDAFDPVQNLDGSARYLAWQLRAFGNTRLALAAYHAGPERARRGLQRVPVSTLTYVARVLRYEREYAGSPHTN